MLKSWGRKLSSDEFACAIAALGCLHSDNANVARIEGDEPVTWILDPVRSKYSNVLKPWVMC